MGHRRRIIVPGGTYHVVNRGAAKQPIFFCDADRVEFGRLLAEVWERFGIEVESYCLMGNHYHLLVRCPEANLSEAMQHLASVFTLHVNARVGRDGPLFRGRFRSVAVDTPEHLLSAVRYIHRNPLDLMGVHSPDQYRWSSHRTYLGHRKAPDFLVTDRILSIFGGDRQRFAAYVGDPSTPADAATSVGEQHMRSMAKLAVLVADDLLDENDSADRRSRAALERTVQLLVAARLGGPLGDRIVASFGFPSAAARRNAMRRARQRSDTDPIVDEAVAIVLRQFANRRVA
ncbi:MAG: transposase [Ilumatobacter sp.]|jgi:putative transposase|uniref:transposase n=1 Tax=Ilumatobacter sp. TaxID=1967498 RepID=UPI00391B371D